MPIAVPNATEVRKIRAAVELLKPLADEQLTEIDNAMARNPDLEAKRIAALAICFERVRRATQANDNAVRARR